jgi:hypothetical protein
MHKKRNKTQTYIIMISSIHAFSKEMKTKNEDKQYIEKTKK